MIRQKKNIIDSRQLKKDRQEVKKKYIQIDRKVDRFIEQTK